MLDSSGNLVVQYRYDAWGKLLATSTLTSAYTTLANLNPLRYRGYVYDTETGLYYLRSRYYNPEWCRFISTDTLLGKTRELLSHNGFVYCGNEPTKHNDYSGFLKVAIELYTISSFSEDNAKYDFSEGIVGQKFKERIIASYVVKNRIKDYIIKSKTNGDYYCNKELIKWDASDAIAHFSMADLDLALSVGKTPEFTMSVERENKGIFESLIFWGDKYKVTYTLADRYDFDCWEGTNRKPLEIWINDKLGYDQQENGILHIFDYTVSGSFYVYVY